MEDYEVPKEKKSVEIFPNVLRFLSFICALILLAIGLLSYITLDFASYTLVLPFFSMYAPVRIFGSIILIPESKSEFLISYFKFIDTDIGKGCYLML